MLHHGSLQTLLQPSTFAGRKLCCNLANSRSKRFSVCPITASTADEAERLRLHNLSPQEGSRPEKKRKGRGYGAGQGGSAGYGMRGQKSRSGSGIRPGFEGGQTPLYRRLPKLKGIAGGMGAGLPDFVTVNLEQLNGFAEGEEVTLETLQEKRVLNLSGRSTRLPLKVLGSGELKASLTIRAAAFSASAKDKIENAGGKAVEIEQKPKWKKAPRQEDK